MLHLLSCLSLVEPSLSPLVLYHTERSWIISFSQKKHVHRDFESRRILAGFWVLLSRLERRMTKMYISLKSPCSLGWTEIKNRWPTDIFRTHYFMKRVIFMFSIWEIIWTTCKLIYKAYSCAAHLAVLQQKLVLVTSEQTCN